MKIACLTICGEKDHPLFKKFEENASKIFDQVVIVAGVVEKWKEINGNTYPFASIFKEKHDQQNYGIEMLDRNVDYVCTFDIDEFISADDMALLRYELERFEPDCVRFRMYNFWKGFEYIAIKGDGWGYDTLVPRVWKFRFGMEFICHRPPTINFPVNNVYDSVVKIHHFSYVYDLHVERKMRYYKRIYPELANHYDDWFENCFKKWTPENKMEIESKYSVHPSVRGAYTIKYYNPDHLKIFRIDKYQC